MSSGYGSGQRMPTQQTYEAPACVQNAMMTKERKPFTYTPGGIDLSQIKSERMAKRLARNAQAEGATGVQQQNRPTQPQSPGGTSPSAAAAMGAAAMGMPFQVLPPPPPPGPGKNFNSGSGPAPPPPPPPTSSTSNFSNTGTLAPPANGNAAGGGRGSTPNSPNMPRKSPTPQLQRFEPPPMGFRPEIKIPPNPMAALRKVPPPVEKNTFWKDEYVKERSKSPMVDSKSTAITAEENDNVNSNSSSPQTTNANNSNNNGTATISSDNIDGLKKTMPTTTTTNNITQPNQPTNNSYTNYQQQQQQQQQLQTPPTPNQTQQQSPLKPIQQSPQYSGTQPPSPQQQQQQQQHQVSPISQQETVKPEFRSGAAPISPAVNIYNRQTDSPRSMENVTPPRATESPFKYAQQQQQQQRTPPAVSPLAQQSSSSSASSIASVCPNPQAAQTVPWRTQRTQPQPQQAPTAALAQSHPQPIFNNVQTQVQKTPDFSTQSMAYQGPKPTNVGSLYIAPLAPPTEPQAQHIVRQQLQQQQRDSPMRQIAPQQQQQQQPQPTQQLRWMSTQPLAKEQPAWARPEENGNVVPSTLNRIKSPPPPAAQQPVQITAAVEQGNGFIPQASTQNFGAHPPSNNAGLRLQINVPLVSQTSNQNGPRERIIPIQLEQTPTYTPAQPNFNAQSQQYVGGNNSTAPGYVMRTPNQFVDQGYNNFGQQQQQQQPQRVMSPTLQQLNAPRIVQQTQNSVASGHKTHIIPIALDDGTRGPISKTPIVIQNDQRTPPIQSKSFRILQKITDTIGDGSNDDQQQQLQQQQQQQQAEPQLQRPTFARQMSAQQARHSPTVEQMRRMQIGHEHQGKSAPSTPLANVYNNQQRYFNDNLQQYIPPSEQQAAEPKKYTGSAIPSRSFKILQAMTQPENAEEQESSQTLTNEMSEIESKPDNSCFTQSSTAEPVTSYSSSSINSELAFSSLSSPSPTPPPAQSLPYPPYPYPYGYPWYPPPPPPPHPAHINNPSGENTNIPIWPPYPYGMPTNSPLPTTASIAGDHASQYPPYPYYYPYYPPPPPPPPNANNANSCVQPSQIDLQNMYAPYMPPPPPYIAYPYPVAPSYSQSTNSSRASSVLPDIIITPSTDDAPSQTIMKHHIKMPKKEKPKHSDSIEIEDVTSLKSNRATEGSVVDILTQHLDNMNKSKSLENNLNSKRQSKKSYKKNIQQKSSEGNTSPVQITMLTAESENETDTEQNSDSEITPKQLRKQGPVRLQSIKSVNNIQIYQGKIVNNEQNKSSDSESESETEHEDDETTADGESDIFDEEEASDQQVLQESENEEFIVDDSLSVIYEEESEIEKSSEMAKTVIQGDRSRNNSETPEDLDSKIEENDTDDAEEREDSNSVTVRLPLKFSFSSTKDAENIATVEVGKSQIEEKRNSVFASEKRNSFSVATVESDTEDEEYDDCDVSVTISLTPSSSKSSNLDCHKPHKNLDDIYAVEDLPSPEEALEQIETSQEDVSAYFSLNMRNKFANETTNGGLINNLAPTKESAKTVTEIPEEMDFFATLRATKMQAQKIKEQSACYWGKSTEAKKKEANESEKDKKQTVREEETNARIDFWSKYSQNKTENEDKKTEISTECSIVVESNKAKTDNSGATETTQEVENILANKTDDNLVVKGKAKQELKNANAYKETKTVSNFEIIKKPVEIKNTNANNTETIHDSVKSKATKQQIKNTKTTTKELKDNWTYQQEKEVAKTNNTFIETEEIEDIWAEKEEKQVRKSEINTRIEDTVTPIPENFETTNGTEELVDIWADRVDDLPLIKPIKPKLKTLETATDSFWNSVAEAQKTTDVQVKQEQKIEKILPKPEAVQIVALNIKTLTSNVYEVSQPQTALVHYEKENQEKEVKVEEVDFWAQIEKSRESNTPEPKYEYMSTFGETETSMYNDEHISRNESLPFDPLKYPEEPREVDTDEEIDFWAEIQAKHQAEREDDDDDVNFHKSASFWASRERQNSVDETPYKPVLPKPFKAKLPDEPPTEDLNIWQTLEAHKGEEPVIVDPDVEEEKALVQEYDEMMENNKEEVESIDDIHSVHEPVVASVWGTANQDEVKTEPKSMETDFWAQIKEQNQQEVPFAQQEKENATKSKELTSTRDELEIKRNNYRKAMAFFTTSIDDNKEQSIDRFERSKSKSNRNSVIEEESEKWDWDAVNEALKQEHEEPAKQETFDKEATPKVLETNIPAKKENEKEDQEERTSLREVCVEPEPKLLSNGLPDLEINKFNERKISVKDRITAFESGSIDKPSEDLRRNSIKNQSLSVESYTRQSSLSRTSSTQRSESEMDEDDSGVTDMNKQLSETDTESESFPELRKMSSYQRAATHSRLFKLLQEDTELIESNQTNDEFQFKPSRRKIVHNVSITRKQNPQALAEAETMTQRRERLSLPLRKNTSIDADNPSTPNSPASPILGNTANKLSVVSDKLVSELVQSLLLKSDSTHLKNLPMEKLQAAAKRVLEEELDSLENTSVESTPAITPNEMKKDKSYADYYNTWSDALGNEEIIPSKAFKALQDTRPNRSRSPWTARCPRVLSSKTINRDLSRVNESPEISLRSSNSPECFRQSRDSSVSKWRKS